MIAEITLGLVAVHLLLTLWSLRILVLEIQTTMAQLDSMLATAIQRVLEEGGLGGFEPVNPIQKALAEMLTSRITQGGPVEVIQRTHDGKFGEVKLPDSGNS